LCHFKKIYSTCGYVIYHVQSRSRISLRMRLRLNKKDAAQSPVPAPQHFTKHKISFVLFYLFICTVCSISLGTANNFYHSNHETYSRKQLKNYTKFGLIKCFLPNVTCTTPHRFSLKGIVSPDWKGLQMVSLDRFEV
jgi:hypothetical protein